MSRYIENSSSNESEHLYILLKIAYGCMLSSATAAAAAASRFRVFALIAEK